MFVSQHEEVLLEVVLDGVLRNLVLVVLVVLLDADGQVGRFDLLALEAGEIDVLHPIVFLELVDAIGSQPAVRVPLQQLVDEVDSVQRPSIGQFLQLDSCLPAEDLVADLLPVLAHIGPPAQHELVGHDSDCEVIHPIGVVLPAHHFGRHVAGRATRVLVILLFELPAHS